MEKKEYHIKYCASLHSAVKNLNSAEWNSAQTALIAEVRPESRGEIPMVKARLMYGKEGIGGAFYVENEIPVCTHLENMSRVWEDSCVEFFVKPGKEKGYFNFEFNCLGHLYASYIIDPEMDENGFKEFIPFEIEDCGSIEVYPSLKETGDKSPIHWSLQFYIPINIIEKYAGAVSVPYKDWECNFYKCADKSANPHWAAWSPVKELNFHAPECFGKIIFEEREN